MEVTQTDLSPVKVITPRKFGDHRGFFSETYNRHKLTEAGIDLDFVQDNHSLSAEAGVLRGLHYQTHPSAQDKLVRVVRGSVLDVAVDIRRDSPTFGQYLAVELSSENWRQLLVPIGFAHGFITLEPNTEVLYKVTNFYSPDDERGIAWNDPDLAINWQLPRAPQAQAPTLSERDQAHPNLADQPDLF